MEYEPHKCVEDEFKGNKILKIIKVDDEGNEIEKFGTIVSFGFKKAAYIVKNIEEIKKFVEENDK
ncbi:MAG: hypothetical protein CME70_21945 [Halobacteriovorax sp.]|nr:hypothetical protein [Halobacteriovorax sp.]|tara:strand:+ start:67584 stop:67778 length:195 start_codon:yes stop_codon:yes gene_type:complete